MKNKISRRDFLKGAAAGAASLAAAGVLGACASDTQATTAATEAPTQASEAPAPAASASSDTWYDAAYFAKPAPSRILPKPSTPRSSSSAPATAAVSRPYPRPT